MATDRGLSGNLGIGDSLVDGRAALQDVQVLRFEAKTANIGAALMSMTEAIREAMAREDGHDKVTDIFTYTHGCTI